MHQSCTFYTPKYAHFPQSMISQIRQALPDLSRK
jgi:hypothetical protein